MLEQLLELAPSGSEGARLASYHLSRLIVGSQPWRSARLARELLSDPAVRRGEGPATDQLWAVLGVAHTVMGNYHSARRAQLRALELAPHAPSHLHNLGHLVDVAFEQPREALRYLRAAHEAVPEEPEIASSYAHALVRAGFVELAREVLGATFAPDLAESFIARWAGPDVSAGKEAPDADGVSALEAAEA